jgi:hypothetical protein
MVFTSKVKLPKKIKEKEYVFLAGSMDYKSSSSWRDKVINEFDDKNKNFFDPTNIDHDELNESEMESHIQWELEAMSMADKIVLNFLPDSLSPISLVELGLYVQSEKLVVVCPKEFYQSNYVYVLCEKYNTPAYPNIDEALNRLLN